MSAASVKVCLAHQENNMDKYSLKQKRTTSNKQCVKCVTSQFNNILCILMQYDNKPSYMYVALL